MPIPGKAVGAGDNQAANVFKVTFSYALSTAPIYQAWDNSGVYPEVDVDGLTATKEIFVGTVGNGNLPYLYLVDTNAGNTPPGSASWKPSGVTAGSANPNRLKGATSYVTAQNIPNAGGFITFNIGAELPFDASVPSVSSCDFLLQIKYTYTGNPPTLTYAFNQGTESVPVWTTLTPGSDGIRFCNAGTSVTGPYKFTLPNSGVLDAQEVWITTS